MDILKQILVRSYLDVGKAIDLEAIQLPIFKFFGNKYWNRNDVHMIIPKNKHREQAGIYERALENIPKADTEDVYLNRILPLFESIEENGIFTTSGTEHSKYNLYTLTGRPSNTNDGINYAALNKDDGSRARFVSRHDNGLLVEFDYDAYHLRLIAGLIGYEFPEKSVHTHLGKMYFDTNNLTNEEYEESKRISFRVLYGGIPKEFENIEYFRIAKAYIFELWDNYNDMGYIKTPIFGRRFYKKNYEDMTPQKLFNYLIQAYETEVNIEVMEKIQTLLSDCETKLVLYTYDSFLFDVSPKDGKDLLLKLKNLMGLPTKSKYGKNYDSMKPLAL
jgi:hypothetical protein